MIPGDPQKISKPEHIKGIAAQMKVAAGPDDDLENYSKTTEDADVRNMIDGMTQEEYEYIKNHGASRAVIYQDHLYSLSLTEDDHHGHQWHFSFTEITGPVSMDVPEPSVVEFILDGFFSSWKPIQNPGKMKTVLHFVGND